MPDLLDINDFVDDELTAQEVNYLRRILRYEAPETYVPLRADVDAAVLLLTPEERQEIRAIFDSYGQIGDGQVEINGGTDALTYDAVLERWSRRNDIRGLLRMGLEPRPTGGGIWIGKITFVDEDTTSEFGV